jgi:hypothetical protein
MQHCRRVRVRVRVCLHAGSDFKLRGGVDPRLWEQWAGALSMVSSSSSTDAVFLTVSDKGLGPLGTGAASSRYVWKGCGEETKFRAVVHPIHVCTM